MHVVAADADDVPGQQRTRRERRQQHRERGPPRCAVPPFPRKDFADHGLDLPVYWGNRNWAPYLTDTLREM
ncbi:hypothetical protein ACWDZW_41395, partial [Streptomyces coeruleorubidus]